MATNTLTYDIVARDRASKTLDTVGKKFGGLSKSMGLVAGAAAGLAVVAGARMLKGFVEDAAEAAKISRITANAIKVTGSAAKVTTKQVEDLSEALSNKTAVDDELIQSGANLLLTFKNVRNEAGKGNKIFDQATAAAVDLSAAGFGSVESAAKMLGKALNDPERGLTALSKAGVTFTEKQKKTIATLVEQGDLLGAQKIIMTEIATQVGGAAEAAASPWDKLKTTFANLGEELGATLLPYLEDLATWLIDEGVPKIEDAIRVFEDEWLPAIEDIWKDIQDNLIPILEKAAGWIADNTDLIWLLVGATVAWKVEQLAVNAAISANPLVAFLTLVTGAVLIFQEMNDVTGDWHKSLEALGFYIANVPILGPLFKMLGDFEGAIDRIQDFFITAIQGMLNFFLEGVEIILDGVEAAFGWAPIIGPAIRDAQDKFKGFRDSVNTTLNEIKDRSPNVRISISSNAGALAADVKARFTGLATGGPVFGIGGPTSDSVLARLSPGEHVWTAAEVQAFGGHKAMALARRQIVHGYAAGGVVTPNAVTPPVSPTMFKGVNDAITAYTAALGDYVGTRIAAAFKKMANALTNVGPGIAGSGRLFPLPPGTYHKTQGPHDGGAIDWGAPYGTPVRASFNGLLNVTDLGNRSYGKYYQLVAPGQRSILGAHLSSFAHGDGPILRGQLIGRVGSTGNSTGPHLHLRGFDKGGWLPPGLSLAFNGTGQPEKVTPGGSGDARGFAREFVREMRNQGLILVPTDAKRAELIGRAG